MSEEEELLEAEVEQTLEDAVAGLRTIADQLESGGDELTIEYGGTSATIPAPDGPVEFALEIERERDDEVEIELEVELEWEVTPGTEDDEPETDGDEADEELNIE